MIHTLHGDFTLSGTLTLTNIPRKSTITIANTNIGQSATIKISRASSSFTHTLTYEFGSLSGTIATKTTLTSVPFEIPMSFYNQIPNSPSGTVTVTCTTYNGSTSLGSNTATFSVLAVEDDCRPSVTATLVDVNDTTIALTGDNNKLIKNKSIAKITPTATLQYGATVKTIQVVTEIATYTIPSEGYLQILNVASETFEIIVTDTRGFKNTQYILTPTVIPYVNLSVNATFERLAATSSEVKVDFTGNYYSGSFGSTSNSLSLVWKWKEAGATDWEDGGSLNATISNSTFYGGGTLDTTQEFDYQESYDFILIATDKLVETNSSGTVLEGVPYFDYGKTGTKENYFNINGGMYVKNKNIFDLIYPVGSIYMSMNLVDPSTLFGGTWERMSGGFLYGAVNTADTGNGTGTKTGAATGNTGSTALTISQIPSHTHSFTAVQRDTNATTLASGSYGYVSSTLNTGATGGGAGHTHTLNSHTHVVPFMAVFTWKRIA